MKGFEKFLLFVIFALAIILRFLYFPKDVYFGYDQARDAFASFEILNGHLKLVGPTTSFEGLRHGVLHYYFYAPFYLVGAGNPEIVSAFIRIFNCLGVFLIFALSTVLFNKYVGLISAFLFAVSFEQTQFALYFSNPSFDVISVLLMYLGLSILIFRKKDFGLIIGVLGLGLSIQFQFFMTYLLIPFVLILILFRKSIPSIKSKTIFLTLFTFLIALSTFIIAEIKYSFRSVSSLYKLFTQGDSGKSFFRIISTYFFEMGQLLKFNFIGNLAIKRIFGLSIVISTIILFSKTKKQIIFLLIWFLSNLSLYFVTGGETLDVDIIQYHPNVGISASIIIFISYIIYKIYKRTHIFVSITLLFLIFLANFGLIQKYNPSGSMPELMAQSGMLLSDEKKVLDFIYKDASGNKFAVKAITLPFYVNTTWSYLFEWYGKKTYGYVPIWGGKNAAGYPGSLQIIDAQSELPDKRYLIIEPLRGIPINLVQDYLREESYFSNIIKEEQIGFFKVQVRIKKD